MSARHLFVFGLGYVGQALARACLADGWTVSGTYRNAHVSLPGVTALPFGPDHPLPADALAGVSHILIAIPPPERGESPLASAEATIAGLNSLEWLGYLSSTAVYGDTGGEWVGETAWLHPGTERARRRVDAERRWFDLCRRQFVPSHVFRLAGIYGPGRSAIDALRAGRAHRVDKPGHVFCRIHIDDIVTTLRASMARPRPGSVYNLADDLPSPAEEVVEYAARLLGIEPPPLVPISEAKMSDAAAAFYAECRRVKNDRIKRQLGVLLAYPNYRSGLDRQIAAERECPTNV